jgi:hypothetical protein
MKNWGWTDDPATATLPRDWRTSAWLEKQHMPEGCLTLTDEEMLKVWRRTCAVRNQELDYFWSMNCKARSKHEEEWRENFKKERQEKLKRKRQQLAKDERTESGQQSADFAEEVARDVAEMRATFRDMQATLAENAWLREERERRLEDWAIEDAWARLRGER